MAWHRNDHETAAAVRPGHAARLGARQKRADRDAVHAELKAEPGSLLPVAAGRFKYDETRGRKPGGRRAAGTIAPRAMLSRKKEIKDFFTFINERHGRGGRVPDPGL